jgi:hypothetical protein
MMSDLDRDGVVTTQPPEQTVVPHEIVKAVKEGKCILFLGAMVSAPAPKDSVFRYDKGPPGGGKLSELLASMCGYEGSDRWNLSRVSLDYSTRNNRNSLIQVIIEAVGNPSFEASPVMRMLADLPFPIIVTTNYDHLFDNALRRARTRDDKPKDPIVRIYDPKRKEPPDEVPPDPIEQRPVLLKIHGDIDVPESIVVTEEDYIVFIQRMTNPYLHPFHQNVLLRMKYWPILFIGYSLKDYNLRLLLRSLQWTINPAKRSLLFSVDPSPDKLIKAVWQGGGEERIIYFVEKDLWEFVPTLYRACMDKEYAAHE